MSFISKLTSAIENNHSLLCVGLDPRPEFLPEGSDIEKQLSDWGTTVINQTADLVCCYKPNIAFYEQFGPAGLRGLKNIIAAVPEQIPVLLDAKRGDIGSTAEAYAAAVFKQLNADAVTLSPYLGEDSIKPFLTYSDKTVFVLCHTSNPSAGEVQLYGDPPLFEFIARCAQKWGSAQQIGFVVGATQPHALARVRELCPQNWILAPGVGAQGADLDEALRAGLREDGSGLIIPVSRGVMQAPDPRQAATDLRENINRRVKSLESEPRKPISVNQEISKQLFASGCVKFGNFTLASGKQSPIYIDLRRMVSYPRLFKMVAQVYSDTVAALKFDHIAAVPYAALPIGAVVAWKLDRSFIYPRKEVKQHGTGQAIEGSFKAGQSAILIEDVITSGGSIISAVETMRRADLVINDVVVLVDREQGGAQKLAEMGLILHPIMTIGEIMETLKTCELIDADVYNSVRNYLNEEANG